jgi:hypothetical protein
MDVLFKEINEKINVNSKYVLHEQIIEKVYNINLPLFIQRVFNDCLCGKRRKVYSRINGFLGVYVEYFSKEERGKLYEIFEEKLNNHILDRELFKEFFDTYYTKPYWERLEGLFQNKKTTIIEKKDYEFIMNKFNEILKRTLRIGLGLEKNEEDAWIENFKNGIEIHEVCEETYVDLLRELRESNIKQYTESLISREKLQMLFINWYQSNGHTFIVENKRGYNIYDYLYQLDDYHYLIDEKNKKIVQKELLKLNLNDFENDDIERWQWVKEQVERYF